MVTNRLLPSPFRSVASTAAPSVPALNLSGILWQLIVMTRWFKSRWNSGCRRKLSRRASIDRTKSRGINGYSTLVLSSRQLDYNGSKRKSPCTRTHHMHRRILCYGAKSKQIVTPVVTTWQPKRNEMSMEMRQREKARGEREE